MPSSSHRIERAKPLLGTVVRIRIEGLAPAEAHAAIGAAFGVVADIHRLMSFQAAASELSLLNRQAWRGPVPVSGHTRAVLEEALTMAEASGGLFDPTVAPALVRWGLVAAPDGRATDPRASWRDIWLLPDDTVFFERPLWLDLSGVAKGYAVDCALARLDGRGASRICVEAGGDLRLAGEGPEAVLIDAPDTGELQPVLEIENAAVASSGRPESGASPMSLHIDPRTGAPCPAGRFVTVVAPRCVTADALTKVVMAAGAAAEPILARHQAQAFLFEGAGWTAFPEAA